MRSEFGFHVIKVTYHKDAETVTLEKAKPQLFAFLTLQKKWTRCLSGSRLAKDRAADTVSSVMIPEALDYPA